MIYIFVNSESKPYISYILTTEPKRLKLLEIIKSLIEISTNKLICN